MFDCGVENAYGAVWPQRGVDSIDYQTFESFAACLCFVVLQFIRDLSSLG